MFPEAAMEFYQELELDNSREFWLANKTRYGAEVRGPLLEVAAQLEGEFGTLKLFRPNRDVRFSADKSPYKTHQGLYGQRAHACGYYAEVNARECLVAGGNYDMRPETLALFRSVVAERGHELAGILADLEADGWVVGGDQLKTAPRGYPKDHPHIALLRHRTLSMSREVLAESLDAFVTEVAESWRELEDLIVWLQQVTLE